MTNDKPAPTVVGDELEALDPEIERILSLTDEQVLAECTPDELRAARSMKIAIREALSRPTQAPAGGVSFTDIQRALIDCEEMWEPFEDEDGFEERTMAGAHAVWEALTAQSGKAAGGGK